MNTMLNNHPSATPVRALRRLRLLPLLLLLAACADDEATRPAAADDQPVAIVAEAQPWHDETIAATRSGETVDAMKASTEGLGLYCPDFNAENVQMLWDEAKKWHNEDWKFWPKGIQTASFYAYAPYAAGAVVSDDAARNLAFTLSAADNQTDLLWANRIDLPRATGQARLTFQHAFARLSFGTVANQAGLGAFTVSSVTVTGDFYLSGNLSLAAATATWTNLGEKPEATISRTGLSLAVPDAGSASLSDQTPILFIPQADMTLTVTLTLQIEGESQAYTMTFRTTQAFEAGKNYQINFAVRNNFHVVIV